MDLLVPPDEDDVNISEGRTDSGEAFRREMAQVQFRNFVHEQQFYSWQFRSARLYGKGEDLKRDGVGEKGETETNLEGDGLQSRFKEYAK